MSAKNPQSGSAASASEVKKKKTNKALPPLFWYMEMGDWEKATERAKRHPREVKTWATLRTKSMAADNVKVSGTKRLALHHACFKLRSVVPGSTSSATSSEDSFIEVCRLILLLLNTYPEAAGMRESRHGCLPIHLASFASCAPRPPSGDDLAPMASPPLSPASAKSGGVLPRPGVISNRSISESTTDTTHTNMSAILAEERFTGTQTMQRMGKATRRVSPRGSSSSSSFQQQPQVDFPTPDFCPTVSVSMRSNILISAKREDMAVQVLNALLDAYPKGIRVDSEGGRLPLHTACAGRATPRVISTLLTAYPAAARHRNKDGFLPLHLAAHWGVSHPNVAITLLKAYPDSTVGRNRWERTPLEEALCMAGENGRPHQAALVRALRKHPSYWTRPPAELFSAARRGRMEGTNIVDIDATLPSSESTEDDERRYFNSGHTQLVEEEDELEGSGGGLMSRLDPRGLIRKGKKEDGGLTEDNPIGGDLPTLIKNQKWKSVLARLECNPDEAEEELKLMTRGGFVSTSGFTPLHYACERRPPVDVVQALVEAFPAALTTKIMPGGCLPLHVACTWHASMPVVSLLLSAAPEACRVTDELGNVPLHSACFSGAMAPIVDALLCTYPKAILARNNQGSLPHDICKRLRHENRRSVMVLLQSRKEEVLAHRRGRSSGSLSQTARIAMELNERDGPPKLMATEALILESAEEANWKEAGVEVPYNDQENQELVWI